MMRYLLIDSPESLEYFQSHKLIGGDTCIVAISRSGSIACEKDGISYKIIEDFSDAAYYVRFSEANLLKLRETCALLDEIYFAKDILKSRGIKPFLFSRYDLKILLDTIGSKFFFSRSFLSKLSPHDEVVCPTERITAEYTGVYFDNADSLYAVVLKAILKSKKFSIRFVDVMSNQEVKDNRMEEMTSVVSYKNSLSEKLKKLVVMFLGKTGLFQVYFLVNGSHDVALLIPYLKQQKFLSLPLHWFTAKKCAVPSSLDNQLRSLFESSASQLRELFQWEEFSMFEVVASRLENLLVHQLGRGCMSYDQFYVQAINIQKAFSVRYLLTSTLLLSLEERCQVQGFRNSGAALVTYQEGAGYGSMDLPIYDFVEIEDGDLFLCYGEGNKEHYITRGIVTKKMAVVGSLLLQNQYLLTQHSDIRESLPKVMYVGTTIEENVMHAPRNGISASKYLNRQLEVFRLLNRHRKRLIPLLKLHPTDKMTADFIKESPEFGKCTIKEGPFQNSLFDADLFIFDFPSTGFLYACLTDKPIFVLCETGVSGFTAENLKYLEGRAEVFYDLKSLDRAIEEYLKNPASYRRTWSSTYLRKYGLIEGNRVEDRVFEVLKSMLSTNDTSC